MRASGLQFIHEPFAHRAEGEQIDLQQRHFRAEQRIISHDIGITRAKRTAGQDALQRLRSGRAEWERQSALDRLLTDAPVFGLSPYAPPLLDLLREPDPDVRCWRLAGAIAALADGWVPAALQPYRERPDLAARFVDRERDALAADLIGWASARS